jgi:hypothetical protein
MSIGPTDTQFASQIDVTKCGESASKMAWTLPDAVRRSRRLVTLQFGADQVVFPAT